MDADFLRLLLVKTREHLTLTFVAMALACVIAVPGGILLAWTKAKRVVTIVLGAVNIVQPIPSIALVALVGLLFMLLGKYVPGLRTIGWMPALIALVAYAILPILRNTYTGIRQVDPAVIEVARAMGMKPLQILFGVQLPLALPFIMAGVRISTVWTIGVAALASLIGAGGLGDLIFRGLANNRIGLILAGAAGASVLALGFDWLLGLVERWLTAGAAPSAEAPR